jgi:hypothetical protein
MVALVIIQEMKTGNGNEMILGPKVGTYLRPNISLLTRN